jgi:hypothetical protein
MSDEIDLANATLDAALEPRNGDLLSHSSLLSQAPGPLTNEKNWPTPLAPEAYHGIAGELVKKIEPHTEADNAALLTQLHVVFGNVVGRSAYFEADGSRHYTNLYVVQVGRTAKGRKGTSLKQVMRPIESAQPDWYRECVLSGLSSGEGLIWCVRDAITKREPIKLKGKFTGSYDEIETDPGVEDKRKLIIEEEFASPLKVAQRDGNTLSPLIRLAWDRGDLKSLTKNNTAVATGAHVSIIGHITKDELRRSLDCTETANGFANRFLWVCVQRSKCLPEGGQIHTVDFGPIVYRLTEIIDRAKSAGQLQRDTAARELWHEVYPELSEGKPGMFGAVTSRAEAQVMRLAMIYALLDQSKLIQVEHLRAALAVWRYCDDSARCLFGSSLGDRTADELLAALRASEDGLTRSQMSIDVFGRHKGADEIGRALLLLEGQNLAHAESRDTGGRPAEVWFAGAK